MRYVTRTNDSAHEWKEVTYFNVAGADFTRSPSLSLTVNCHKPPSPNLIALTTHQPKDRMTTASGQGWTATGQLTHNLTVSFGRTPAGNTQNEMKTKFKVNEIFNNISGEITEPHQSWEIVILGSLFAALCLSAELEVKVLMHIGEHPVSEIAIRT
ncbi:hypothetical protein ACTXT7_004405, partial [Hymenolepis weldensis]